MKTQTQAARMATRGWYQQCISCMGLQGVLWVVLGMYSMIQSVRPWLLVPGTSPVGRTDKPKAPKKEEGLQEKRSRGPEDKMHRDHLAVVEISINWIFVLFLYTVTCTFPGVPGVCVVNDGISTRGRAGDVFFSPSRPKKVKILWL